MKMKKSNSKLLEICYLTWPNLTPPQSKEKIKMVPGIPGDIAPLKKVG